MAKANQGKTEGNEKTYPRTNEYKPADKEWIVELKGPQKRASEPDKTATESKLEPALCSLQSAEPDQNSQREIPTAHCSRGLVSANAVFGKCAPNNSYNCTISSNSYHLH